MTGQYGLADLTSDRYAYPDVAVKREQIVKKPSVPKPREPQPIDTRTPSGKPLPF